MEAQLSTLKKTLSYVKTMANATCKRYKFTHVVAPTDPIARIANIRVENRDAIEVALDMKNPLVMILADAHVPGGCIFGGGNMQEESLFRRTALFAHLKKEHYPILPDEALYARDVPVFFDTEQNNFSAMNPGTRLSFIACPGIKMPATDNRNRMLPDDAAALEKKIRLIVQVAKEEGHENLVAGALGCGVWGCPPEHVAEIFRNVINSHESNSLANVTFAILGGLRHTFDRVLLPVPITK